MFFFFQAEDGIRDIGVTRVQTCALPIFCLEFGDSEFLPTPYNRELAIEDWTLDLERYTERALPNEVPMQIFCAGTEPVEPSSGEGGIDPRWRGLGGLFASNH